MLFGADMLLLLYSGLLFLPPMRHDAYLAVNHHCDVMLDTLHWSGGNTALDALSVGLPMVTLHGTLMRGRQSSAMLRRAGLDDLIALDREGYVRIAARLGADREWRMAIRQRSLAGRAALFDDPAPLAALNDVLEGLARDIVHAQA
jgi:CRISPR-associated protein Csy1